MRSYLSLFIFILTGIFLLGCDNSNSPVAPPPPDVIDTVKPSPKAQTCLEAVNGKIPKGTIAQRTSTLQRTTLDTLGCFSFNASTPVASRLYAARTVAEGDSIIFYNDSALFSVTIPFLNDGDTIQVVPTVVSLRNVPDAKVDSVFLAVFDKVNILSRKVKLKRADFGDSSEYGRTLWSVESDNPFQIHFEIHSSLPTWASSVITSEPGGTVTRDYVQIRSSEVPRILNVVDSMYFYTLVNNNGSVETRTPNRKLNPYGDIQIQASSIYGIAEIKVNGVVTNTLTPPVFVPLTVDELLEPVYTTALIEVRDSAGYLYTKSVKMWTDKSVWLDELHPGNQNTTIRFADWASHDSTYSVLTSQATLNPVTGDTLLPARFTQKTVNIRDSIIGSALRVSTR